MGAMKVTIDSTRGVVTERDSNGLLIEQACLFSQPVAYAVEVVTSATVAVTHPVTLIASVINCILTLPSAATFDQQQIKIKKINSAAYSLTVNPVGGQTIDGQDSLFILTQYTAIVLYAAGGNWYIL